MLSSKHNVYSSTKVWSMPVNRHRHLKKNGSVVSTQSALLPTSEAWCQLFSPNDHLNYRWIPLGSCFWQEAYKTKTPQKGAGLNQKGRGGWDKKWMLLEPPNELANLFQSRRSKQWPFKGEASRYFITWMDLCLWYTLYRASTEVHS